MRKGQLVAAFVDIPDGSTWLMAKIEKRQANGKFVIHDEYAEEAELERFIVEEQNVSLFPNTSGPYEAGDHILARWKLNNEWTTELYDAEVVKVYKGGILSLKFQETDKAIDVNVNKVTKYPEGFVFDNEEENEEEETATAAAAAAAEEEEEEEEEEKVELKEKEKVKERAKEKEKMKGRAKEKKKSKDAKKAQKTKDTKKIKEKEAPIKEEEEEQEEEVITMKKDRIKPKRETRKSSKSAPNEKISPEKIMPRRLSPEAEEDTKTSTSNELETEPQNEGPDAQSSSSDPGDETATVSTPLPSSPPASPPPFDESSEVPLTPQFIPRTIPQRFKPINENREVKFIFKVPDSVDQTHLPLLTNDDIAKLLPPIPPLPKGSRIETTEETPLLDCLSDPDLFDNVNKHTTSSGILYRAGLQEHEFKSALMSNCECGRLSKIFNDWRNV